MKSFMIFGIFVSMFFLNACDKPDHYDFEEVDGAAGAMWNVMSRPSEEDNSSISTRDSDDAADEPD